jgi:hypothetical protein
MLNLDIIIGIVSYIFYIIKTIKIFTYIFTDNLHVKKACF